MRKYLELTTLKLLCPERQFKTVLKSIVEWRARRTASESSS